MNKLTVLGIIALAAAVMVTIWVMLQSAHGGATIDVQALLFIGWAISPYVCVLLAWWLVERYTRLPWRSLVFSMVSVLMSAFTLAVYPTVPRGPSSTGTIAFTVVPLDLYIGSLAFLSGGLALAWFLDRNYRSRK